MPRVVMSEDELSDNDLTPQQRGDANTGALEATLPPFATPALPPLLPSTSCTRVEHLHRKSTSPHTHRIDELDRVTVLMVFCLPHAIRSVDFCKTCKLERMRSPKQMARHSHRQSKWLVTRARKVYGSLAHIAKANGSSLEPQIKRLVTRTAN